MERREGAEAERRSDVVEMRRAHHEFPLRLRFLLLSGSPGTSRRCGRPRPAGTSGSPRRSAGTAGRRGDRRGRGRAPSSRPCIRRCAVLERCAELLVRDVARARATARRARPRALPPSTCSRCRRRGAGRAARRRPLASCALGAEPREHRVEVGRLGEDVGAEVRDARRRRERARAPGRSRAPPRTRRRGGRATAGRSARAAPLDAPTALHPQVAAQDEPALEAQQQVLADRLDRLEPAAVEPLGEALRRRARMRRLDLDPLADEHLQSRGGAVQGVTFGHANSLIRLYRRSL